MKGSGSEKLLASLLILGLVLGFLLTPLGLETRLGAIKSILLAPFFLAMAIIVPLVALILLFKRPRWAGILAILDAVLIVFVAPADQAGYFFNAAPPRGITVVEFLLVAVAVGYFLLGPRVAMECDGSTCEADPPA